MTTAQSPTFARRSKDHSKDPVPLAFVFDGNPTEPLHIVTAVDWTDNARQSLGELRSAFEAQQPRQDLPVEALRGRLEVGDPESLRLDRALGLRGQSPTLLWTACGPDEARKRVGGAVIGWLADDVSAPDKASSAVIQHLRDLWRQGALVAATIREARVFAWDQTASGTATPSRANRDGYADLADFVARLLEGEVVFPDPSPLRRVASGQLSQNQAELFTEPVLDQADLFSLVVRIRVLSFPGRATPVVALEVSRRIWTRALRKAAVRHLSAYALPAGRRTALCFTLSLDFAW